MGDIDVDVMNMDGIDSEFNIIMGLPWHREKRPQVHGVRWFTSYEAEQGERKGDSIDISEIRDP